MPSISFPFSQNDFKGIRADLSGKLSVIEP